jgi:CheY-like chemotaxis protein
MSKVRTILYAEDDMVVLTVHRMRLQKEGFHVIAAHDGLDAIKKLSTFVPDLVLLDLMLPTNSVRDITHEGLLEHASKRLIKSQCNSAMLLEAIHEVLDDAPAKKNDRQAFNEKLLGTLEPVPV